MCLQRVVHIIQLMDVDTLKKQRKITRLDVATLLSSMGAPGDNREAKLQVLQSLNRQNKQGHDISLTAESFAEF